MGLEAGTYITELVATNPVGGTDTKAQGDDHIRLLKTVLQATFPGFAGAIFRVQSQGSAYTVVKNDNSKLFYVTGTTWTLSLTAAATLGNGHAFFLLNAASGNITIDANGSELINGALTLDILPGQACIVFCTGTAFQAIIIPGLSAANTWTAVQTYGSGSSLAGAVQLALGNTGNIWTTGDVKLTLKTSADTGWVLMNDGSIGSASSGATTRANVDTEPLYTLLWTNISNTWAPVSSGRGASAAEDFAANKTLTLPRTLGRALAVSGAGATLTSRALGQYLGAETHTLTSGEIPDHTHTVRYYTGAGTGSGSIYFGGGTGLSGRDTFDATATGAAIGGGGDGPHNNMQPSAFMNVMAKL